MGASLWVAFTTSRRAAISALSFRNSHVKVPSFTVFFTKSSNGVNFEVFLPDTLFYQVRVIERFYCFSFG